MPASPDQAKKAQLTDQIALNMALDNPDKSLLEIGKDLKNIGLIKHENTVYTKMTLQQYKQRPIAEVEQAHKEHLQRVLMPRATKRWEKALNDKDLSHKDVLPYVQLAARAVHGNDEVRPVIQQVNIKSIQQVINVKANE